MATKRRRRTRGLSQTDQALLLSEFERLAARSDQASDRKRRRKLRDQSEKRARTKRKAKKTPKAKRTRAKAIGEKYNQAFKTQEIEHDFEPPIKVSKSSSSERITDKIFLRFKKAVRFKKGKARFFTWVFLFKTKSERRARYFSSIVRKMRNKDHLRSHLFFALESFLSRFDDYQLRDQVVRISGVKLKEYSDVPKSHKALPATSVEAPETDQRD